MQSDVRKVDVPVEVVGRMVGAGYHWFEGVVCPSAPNSEHKYVLKRKRGDGSMPQTSGDSCASARTINRGALSKLEACAKIFDRCFSGACGPMPTATHLRVFDCVPSHNCLQVAHLMPPPGPTC